MDASFPDTTHPAFPVRNEAYLSSSDKLAAKGSLIVSCPHAGRLFPNREAFERRILRPMLALDGRGDTFTDWLAVSAKDHGGIEVVSTIAPIFLNVGRSVHSLHPKTVRGALDTLTCDPSDIYAEKGQGLVATTCFFTGEPIYAEGDVPDEAEILDRIAGYYTPFHDRLQAHIDATHDQHGYAFVLDVHSCPTFAGEGEPDATGSRRPDIILGSAGGGQNGSCSDEITKMASDLAIDFGYSIGVNNPYQGGFITQRYGAHNADNGLRTEALQIEFARSTYGLNQDTLEINSRENFEKVQDFMDRLLKNLSEYARQQSSCMMGLPPFPG